ncbi:hypothetical protein GQ602_003779 [Ophiocordyceps camponoti-floridani]|uniref:Mid2 domain-containing protein n=1 Tax=Ophiocordyceps camponoti-floridani TaxID=2030778 RepID=A0A8H4VEL9_9HYPO|nr:hypothetical protein GQ602_003779 [Ophiocordyceps camponoti-floridani]
MRLSVHCLLLLLLLLTHSTTSALGSHDGVHRIQKKTPTTRQARLHARDDANTCGGGLKMCPSSLGGRCCPDNYDCARESCYATTRGQSTCGTKVGWYACAAVYGGEGAEPSQICIELRGFFADDVLFLGEGGCCPDGYLCQRAANCVPPSGSPYTYGCPTSQHLCPSSMSYGCCPNGMACAVGQCYSTALTTTMRFLAMTSVLSNGRTTEMTSTVMATVRPEAPTGFPSAADPEAGGDGDQSVHKYYPTAVAQISPPQPVGQGTADGAISGAQVAGLVAGSMSLLGLVCVVVYMLLRRFIPRLGSRNRDSIMVAVGKSASSDDFVQPPPASDTDGPCCPELASPWPEDDRGAGKTPTMTMITPTISQLSRDDPFYPRPSDVSEASSDVRAELEALSPPSELPGSPSSAGDGGWFASTPHSFRWTDGWYTSRRLDVVDEETYG